uniref:Major sperm protein n=1 Tax=Heterorhabditis bacteriophora TaxID=37862 RepID=A0A1I7XQ48_HETBA
MDELAKGITSDTIIRDHVSYNDVKTNKTNLDNFPIKRFVKFDDCDEEANRKTPLTLTRKSHAGHGKPSSIPLSIRPIAEKRIMAPEVEWIKNTFILVRISSSPCDELILIHVDGEVDYIDIVAIRNISSSSVMFKIKTTSPEKFRVRPSAGIIAPGATEIIRVYLQSEYKHSCTREKFLLMALETSNRNTENFGELWKQATNKSKVEHKLRCKIRYDSSTDNSSSGSQPEHRTSIFITQQGHINSLQKQITNMAKTQYLIIVVISLLFAMLIVTMLYERSNYQILRGSTDELASNIRVLQERTKQMTAEIPTALPSFSPRNYDEDL